MNGSGQESVADVVRVWTIRSAMKAIHRAFRQAGGLNPQPTVSRVRGSAVERFDPTGRGSGASGSSSFRLRDGLASALR